MRTMQKLMLMSTMTIFIIICQQLLIVHGQDNYQKFNQHIHKIQNYHQKKLSDNNYDPGIYQDDDKNIYENRKKRAIQNSSNDNESVGTSGQSLFEYDSGKKSSTKKKKDDEICNNMDIRNDVKFFDSLYGCRIIEGFLQIVLIENNDSSAFDNITFPKLREITGYLLLYRVSNLKSIGNMFPNLEIIHGHTLLADYSFMVYEMQNLQEIGLSKLKRISRGGVRIEKNTALCYTNTVDWSSIVVAGENFIQNNIMLAEKADSCPSCAHCPGGYCWTSNKCQKTDQKSTCHPQCLGECFGPNDTDCYTCKNYEIDKKCVEKCPDNLYTYLSRRCLTKEECLEINNNNNGIRTDEDKKWRPFKKSCISQCPDRWEDAINENNEKTCRECVGNCRKIIYGAIIRHISDAQKFRGTTVVNGALEFQIRNGNPNIINELTEAFGTIEEITEYLKVTHSSSITTLSFFKKLKLIKGTKLDINNASLVVLDNPNLSSLFSDNQTIEIRAGRFFFHYNPKLCLSKIQALGYKSKMGKFTEMEVQPESNGEKVACDIVNIKIITNNTMSNSTDIVWDVYQPSEGQSLLSYLLNYIQTDSPTISYEVNSCGNNNTWNVIDIDISKQHGTLNKITKKIDNLKPWTRYAVYVKTLSTRNNNSLPSPTGQSEIIYFRTKPSRPSPPINVISFSPNSNEIVIQWEPPLVPNGPIGSYLIQGAYLDEDVDTILKRDYCLYEPSDRESDMLYDNLPLTKLPLLLPSSSSSSSTTSDNNNNNNNNKENCCKDTNQPSNIVISKSMDISCFKNGTLATTSIGGTEYCGKKENFYINPWLKNSSINNKKIIDNKSIRKTFKKRESIKLLERIIIDNVSSTHSSTIISNLKHSSTYVFSITACGVQYNNNNNNDDDEYNMCSMWQYTHAKTKKIIDADNINNIDTKVISDTHTIVYWTKPIDPNGIIVAYVIEYINKNIEKAKKLTACISGNVTQYNLYHLNPGTYYIRVKSMSIGGHGKWSRQHEFTTGPKVNNYEFLIGIFALIVFTICFILSYKLYESYRKKKLTERLIATVNPDYIETQYLRDHWEIDRSKIKITGNIGMGHFGMVYHGILNDNIKVAIKTIPEPCTEKSKNLFLNEASVMKKFSTYHLVKLIGVVSDGTPPYVVMELMEQGDLKNYLRRVRQTPKRPNKLRLVRMAGEISDGMAYLEAHKYVHRDLAARNCMISQNLVVKIGDFGLARDIYETDYYKVGNDKSLPIRWMSPENLSDGVFSSYSDVWSFGIVIYELQSMAALPYQGMSHEEVMSYILRHGKIQPCLIEDNPCEVLESIQERCFSWNPTDRPSFVEIVAELESYLEQDFCDKSFYHSEEGVKVRNAGIKKFYLPPAQVRFHWGNETARWVRDIQDNIALLDQAKPGTSRVGIFKNGFQQISNIPPLEDVPLDR
ncbi:insulin receptor-like [Aphidius gifuensis]|uniref:insulin receptor-like n=1 Tax=Aphidius gifuensis TaxID=684658 RepID=UPI001CDD2D9F|nr:insulin receptor-like [Aphidius gifuensis]XP_044009400.1 insulin receptor-like [Aphidius gifuensis]XP_044009401.1 insulin receptor-like [Aphidius gifuensis]